MTDHLASLGALGFTCREAVLHIARELVRTADTYACDPACFMDRALP